MAIDISGLFNTTTPHELRNKFLDSMMVSPAQMGSQSLLQQVVSMGQNAGAMMGEGAGRLFGGKVSGEVEAGYINEAIKQASADKSLTPSQKMEKVAEFLEDKPGMGAQWLKALQESRKMKEQDLTFKRGEVGLETDVEALERDRFRNKVLAPLEARRAQLGIDIDAETLDKSKKINPYLIAQAEQAVERGTVDIAAARERLEKDKFELTEAKDLSPLKKKELENRIALNEFTLAAAKAYEPIKLQKAQYEVGNLMRDETLRNALADLPENASNEQVLTTIRRNGGDPKMVVDALVRTQIADENNKARLEAARLREETKRQLNQQKLAQMPKDAAEKLSETVLLENSNDKIDGFIKLIDDKKVDFSPGGQASSYVRALVGKPTQKELDMANIRAAIKQQANAILQAAKGTQTEGDAKRALEIITDQLEKNSNAGVKNALQRLKETQTKVIAGNRVYMRARHAVSDDVYNEASGKTTSERPPLSSFNN